MNKIPKDVKQKARRKNTAIYQVAGLLVFIVVGVLIYSNTLKAPFVFDDHDNIDENPDIRLTTLNLNAILSAGFNSHSSTRPLANISFALNYYFHQYNVIGYHCVNIIIHILTGIFLYFFIKNTLYLPVLRSMYDRGKQIAFFVALLWLVHPIQTQSVTYIVQRMTSMSGMFYILSLLCYVKGRLAVKAKKKNWCWFAGCVLCGVLAVGSKETAVTLPFFILLYEWYFFQDLSNRWLKRSLWYIAGACIIFVTLGWLFLDSSRLGGILSGYAGKDYTLIERVLTQFRVVIYYLRLLVYPAAHRFNLDYDFAISRSLINPVTTLLCLAVIVGLIGLSFGIARRERLFSFCILCYFGNLVIESSVIALEIVYEHRLYVPSMFVFFAIVLFAWRFIKPHWVRIAIICIVVTVCSVWTYQRNSVWGSRISLWEDCVAKSPRKARPHINLGGALYEKGRTQEALVYVKRALEIEPDNVSAYLNITKVLLKQGKVNEALEYGYKGIQLKPHPRLINSLSWILATYKDAKFRNPKEAVRLAQHACRLTMYKNPMLLDTLAAGYAARGRFTEAIDTAAKALKLAQASKQKELIEEIQNHLDLYKQGKPYIESSK